MHHFHPRVVKFFVSGGQRATYQDVISEQFVKDCGLDKRGYSDADVFEGELNWCVGKVSFVPCRADLFCTTAAFRTN